MRGLGLGGFRVGKKPKRVFPVGGDRRSKTDKEERLGVDRQRRLREISDRVDVDRDIYLSSVKVRVAVREGLIVEPGSCEICGKERVRRRLSAHHEDHAKPFVVRWVCARCHGILDVARKKRLAKEGSARLSKALARKIVEKDASSK